MITHFSIKSIKYDVIEIQGRSMSYSTFSDIDFEMAWVQSTLNTNLRAIHTIATISIAIHAAMSWQVIVKNTLENFSAGGVMINPKYQFVVHAEDRLKDALSEPWTRWVTKTGYKLKFQTKMSENLEKNEPYVKMPENGSKKCQWIPWMYILSLVSIPKCLWKIRNSKIPKSSSTIISE